LENTCHFTAVIERDEDAFVARCPELDIASQSSTVEEARTNLVEAIELFFEAASPEELRKRVHDEVFVTRVEVKVGGTEPGSFFRGPTGAPCYPAEIP
jgi:predicted RNase H-like HicB family nuclease